MKKLLTLTLITFGLLSATTTMAQKTEVKASEATKEKGYTVLNAGEPIVIYKYQHAGHSPKEVEKYVPKYFFTTSSSDILQEFTKANLKKTFPNAHPFHDVLDANFKSDKELIEYDDFHKMYKISRIYTTTVK